MRMFVVEKLVQLAQWLSPSSGVADQLEAVRGTITMDAIMINSNWNL